MYEIFSLHKLEYGTEPEVVVSTPGIVNLLGEHTDYYGGFVLQAALNRSIRVAMSKRKDSSLRFYSVDFDERKRTTITNLKYKREDRWSNYPKGVLLSFLQSGCSFKGIDITIKGDIPIGIGLGASAALEMAVAVGTNILFNLDFTDLQMMKIAASAESNFMSIDTTLSDQITSCMAREGQAMFFDQKLLKYSYVPFVFGEVKLLITNSNVPSVPVEAELAERKEKCLECMNYLRKKRKGSSLRDYTSIDIKTDLGFVSQTVRRLCLHVVEENQRVLAGKDALLSGDAGLFGELLNRSHESLRDNYEVSCPELDWLVKRACELHGVIGSRMTGSGFGGCTISLINEHEIEKYTKKLEEYEHIFGFDPKIMICEPSSGVKVIYPERVIIKNDNSFNK